MFNKLKDMGGMLKKAKEMKSQMAVIQNELKKLTFSAFGFNKKIEVIVNGEMEILEVKVDPSALDANKIKDFQKGLKDATNEALKRAKHEASSKFSAIAGGLGLNLPGL